MIRVADIVGQLLDDLEEVGNELVINQYYARKVLKISMTIPPMYVARAEANRLKSSGCIRCIRDIS